MKDVIIVTRHPALVEVLAEDFGITGKVIAHACGSDLDGKDVVGVLPLYLAARARTITEVTVILPPELRGVELSAAQVRQNMTRLQTFVVRTAKEYNASMMDAWDCGLHGGHGPIPLPYMNRPSIANGGAA